MFVMNVSASAENETVNKVENVEAYDINTNINSLARYLNLTDDQVESVENVQKVFEESIRYSAFMDGKSRSKMIKNAVNYDLKNMRYILDEEQFKKYRVALNATMLNRRLE
jgi:hypothetical protein